MSPAEQPNNQTPEASEPGNKLNEPPKKRWDGPENITGKVTWPLRNITGQHELIHMVMRPDGNPDELAAAIQSLRADYGHVLTDEVIEEALRRKPNGRQEWMRKKCEEIDRAIGIPTSTSFQMTDNGGFIQEGPGYMFIGMGGPISTPRPAPPVADLRKAAEHPHNYPDLAQPPVTEHFSSAPAFNELLLRWLVNVAPTVVRRNKRRERLELKPGVTAKEIADSIRARAKGETGYPPSDESSRHSN